MLNRRLVRLWENLEDLTSIEKKWSLDGKIKKLNEKVKVKNIREVSEKISKLESEYEEYINYIYSLKKQIDCIEKEWNKIEDYYEEENKKVDGLK